MRGALPLAALLAAPSIASAAEPVASWDLESDDGACGVEGDEGQWEWGSFPADYGPGGGLSGVAGWATRLGQPYLNDAQSALVLPAWPLDGLTRPVLALDHWYAVEGGDVARVERWLGGGWQTMEPVYGYPTAEGFVGSSVGWTQTWFDLSGLGDLSEVRLTLETDAAVQLAGWYIDRITLADGDLAPPQVLDLDVLPDTEDLSGPYGVSAEVVDDQALAAVWLLVEADGTALDPLPMSQGADMRWEADIPGPWPPGTTLRYRVQADDGENSTIFPVVGAYAFRARLPAPEGLRGPEGRVVDTEATLAWDPPETHLHTVEGYRVYRGGEVLAEVTDPTARVPLLGAGLDVFSVAGIFEAGEGDPSAELALEVYLPEVRALTPAEAWPGDSLRVALRGRYLLLEQGQASASLGEGIAVSALEVLSADEALLHLEVAANAVAGPRDLLLQSGGVAVEATGAFEVRGDGAAPALTGLSPDAIRQGEELTLRVSTSAELVQAPDVDLGEGLIVESVVLLSAGEVEVRVVADPTAALGLREVVLDDGTRLLGGQSLRVRDQLGSPDRVCASAGPGAALWGGLVGLLALAGRRRR